MRFSLIHPIPKTDAPALGMRAVVRTAQACGWQADLYLRDQPLTEPLPLLAHAGIGRQAPDLIGFSTYSPSQFPNVPAWLRAHDLAPRAADRSPDDPLIIAGGPAVANPGPILPFPDAFVMGDAEVTLPALLQILDRRPSKDTALDRMAELPAVYVPGRSTRPAQWLTVDHCKPISHKGRVLAARGCRYNCAFCQIPQLQKPHRPAPLDDLVRAINATPKNLSLCAPALSHHPDILPLLNLLRIQQRYLYSMNACHHDLTPALIHTLSRVATRITIGVEGTSKRLRRSVGKPISDEALGKLTLTLLQRFVHVSLYVIVGLPGEEERDQDQFIALVARVLRQRKHCWKGNPGKLHILPTTFQAMPHTTLERAAAPPAHLVARWNTLIAQLKEQHDFLIAIKCKTPQNAHITFALHRAGVELAPVIEGMGKLPQRTSWRDYVQRRFLRLCQEHEINFPSYLEPLLGKLPWSTYCTTR